MKHHRSTSNTQPAAEKAMEAEASGEGSKAVAAAA
jgi:hypothetical protein